MSYNSDTVGLNIKVARTKACMTQQDLSEATGIDVVTIGRYEKGLITPRFDRAYALAVALGCTLDDLCPTPAITGVA